MDLLTDTGFAGNLGSDIAAELGPVATLEMPVIVRATRDPHESIAAQEHYNSMALVYRGLTGLTLPSIDYFPPSVNRR